MKKSTFANFKFVKTVVKFQNCPTLKGTSGKDLPEIAIAGRSNVGKSSVLNDLFRNKGFARISSKPGKTQALNFFTDDNIAFVDLPGYGYAAVPQHLKKSWGPMIQTYLQKRSSLALILFLLDVRHLPTQQDKQFFEWIKFYDVPFLVIFTKIDKVKKSALLASVNKIIKSFGSSDPIDYVCYSIPKKHGRKPLIAKINEVLVELD